MVIALNGSGLSSEELVEILTAAPNLTAPPPVGPAPYTFVGQVGPVSNGGAATASITLEAGAYTYICFVFDPEANVPHAALGMWKELTVQ